MEKFKYIRTIEPDSNSKLLIFKVVQDGFLSEVLPKFKQSENLKLPTIKVCQGDFIWITNMGKEEVKQLAYENSSKTRTWILQLDKEVFNFKDCSRMEEVKC